MQRGRFGLVFGALGHPPFCLAQVTAAKQEAALVSLPLPFLGAGQQSGMVLFPIQVGIQRCDEFRKLCVKTIPSGEVNPLELGDRFRDILVWNWLIEDGNYPLVVECGVIDLFSGVD